MSCSTGIPKSYGRVIVTMTRGRVRIRHRDGRYGWMIGHSAPQLLTLNLPVLRSERMERRHS